MAPPLSQNLTEMLQAWSRGDRSALDRLRYFAGLGIEETSEVLGVSPARLASAGAKGRVSHDA
jgi:hypothetical protein